MESASAMAGSSSANFEPSQKSKKKKKKGFQLDKTYRFTINLAEKPDQYEFNWLDLIAEEEDKRKPSISLDPCASDDEDQLKALARKFESKYGAEDIRKQKKARKIDDYADLGYGYDSNDPFIDNSDVHDEIVPENLTTAHGGFYVNCGPLEFKARESADEDSDMEAIIQEGEKAAKKRKYRKLKEDFRGSPPPAKKVKKVKRADGTIAIVSVEKKSAGSNSGDSSSDKAKRSRPRKEGGKPLGRPKMRSPDGSLVHPPKLPRVKKPVLLNSPLVNSAVPAAIPSPDVKLANPIQVKKAAGGKRQVMKVSTPGVAKMKAPTVIDLTGTPASGSIQLKKVTDTSPNSTITDQLVRDAQVRMLANTVDSMMKGISAPIGAGTTLAGGATISPASSSAKKKKPAVNNSSPKISLTANPKSLTVKDQLGAVRKQQNGKNKGTPTGSSTVKPPQHDMTKLMEFYSQNPNVIPQDAAAKMVKINGGQKSVKKQITPVVAAKPTMSQPNTFQQKQVQQKKKAATTLLSNSAPKKQHIAQVNSGAFNQQQFIDMFNMQGAASMNQLQALISHSQANPAAYQDLLKAYSSPQDHQHTQKTPTSERKSPVTSLSNTGGSTAKRLPSSLSIENLSRPSITPSTNAPLGAKSSPVTTMGNSSSQSRPVVTSSSTFANSAEKKVLNSSQSGASSTINYSKSDVEKLLQSSSLYPQSSSVLNHAKQQELQIQYEAETQVQFILDQQEEKKKRDLENQKQEAMRRQKMEADKRAAEAQRKSHQEMEIKRQQEEAQKRREQVEAQRRQEEEAQKYRELLDAQRRQQEEAQKRRELLDAQRRQQEEVQKRQEAQQQEVLRRQQQQKEAQKRQQQEEALKRQQQEETLKRQQQEEALKRQQQEDALKRQQQLETHKRLQEHQVQDAQIKRHQQLLESQRRQQETLKQHEQLQEAHQRRQQQQQLHQVVSPSSSNNPFAGMQPMAQAGLSSQSSPIRSHSSSVYPSSSPPTSGTSPARSIQQSYLAASQQQSLLIPNTSPNHGRSTIQTSPQSAVKYVTPQQQALPSFYPSTAQPISGQSILNYSLQSPSSKLLSPSASTTFSPLNMLPQQPAVFAAHSSLQMQMPNMSTLEKSVQQQFQGLTSTNNPGYYTVQK